MFTQGRLGGMTEGVAAQLRKISPLCYDGYAIQESIRIVETR
jgi:hypothetical protein